VLASKFLASSVFSTSTHQTEEICTMIRTIFRDNRMLFGPLTDGDLLVVSKDPVFDGHGLVATAAPKQPVEIYVSLPADSSKVRQVNDWFLRNHKLLT
jgi:hypothetical protein